VPEGTPGMASFSGSAGSSHFRFSILLCVLVQTTNPFHDREHASTSINETAILAKQEAIFPNELRLIANNPYGTEKKTGKFPDQER
jgi:hypothetical protein